MAAHEPHVSHKHVSDKEELTFRLSKILFQACGVADWENAFDPRLCNCCVSSEALSANKVYFILQDLSLL